MLLLPRLPVQLALASSKQRAASLHSDTAAQQCCVVFVCCLRAAFNVVVVAGYREIDFLTFKSVSLVQRCAEDVPSPLAVVGVAMFYEALCLRPLTLSGGFRWSEERLTSDHSTAAGSGLRLARHSVMSDICR